MSNVEQGIMNVEGSREFDLEERLIDFAVRVIRTAESLPKTKIGNHISRQLIRSGTSPAPNYGEAQSAESRADFIHKMRLALKELRETRIWLLIIVKAGLIKPVSKLDVLIDENNQLISIFVTSIGTAKQNKNKTS
ncbi:MAG: four helix bundle protein [Desulfobacterales bacterium]|nr:four helix bundle protein [Desulfobacterales bacterium]